MQEPQALAIGYRYPQVPYKEIPDRKEPLASKVAPEFKAYRATPVFRVIQVWQVPPVCRVFKGIQAFRVTRVLKACRDTTHECTHGQYPIPLRDSFPAPSFVVMRQQLE
jgi:hypothetical protein